MKQITLVLFFFFSFTTLICEAQRIAPLRPALQKLNPIEEKFTGESTPVNFTDKTNSGAKLEVLANEGNSSVFQVEVPTAAKSHYAVQAAWKSETAIHKGDIVLARFSIHAKYAKQESGEAVVYFYVQHSGNFEKSVISDISVGPEWKTIEIPFVAVNDMPTGVASVCMSFGALSQKVEIANLQLLNFGKKATLAEMPATKFTYQGRENNAAWRVDALKRIEELRTAPLVVQVLTKDGKPLKGAKVHVELVQSDFIWGTAVNDGLLTKDSPNSENYKRYLKEFFNTAVIENGFKAGMWQAKPQSRESTMKAFEWLEKEGFRQRGHNLVWPGWKFNSALFKNTAATDTAQFRALIEEDVLSKMTATKGRLIAWDVINEPLHERDFLPYLSKDIQEDWFKIAKKIDPRAKLYINEYGLLNSIASPANSASYIDTIALMMKKGAPIEGIGIQGHVGRQPRNPAQVLTDLDLFKKLNLPIQITEFDINMTDEDLQADYTRDFLIACYSHPLVTGFTIWGFWQGAHWKPDAAMFRKDWIEKPNAKAWREWVLGNWKTKFELNTNQKGLITGKGHLGNYKIEVTKNGVKKTMEYQLKKSEVPIKIIFQNMKSSETGLNFN
jgi:endo-1,4-beta-xylanase